MPAKKATTTPNAMWIIDFICVPLVVRTRGPSSAAKDVLASPFDPFQA